MSARAAEIAANLADVRDRIAAACARSGRAVDEVTLLAVTKTFPASDAVVLTGLGVRDLAENRDQEASEKAPQVDGARWHMVGRLQRNKARSVVRWADEVQSVDSLRLAEALGKAVGNAREAGERTDPLDVLIQASIDGDTARGGCPLGDIRDLAYGLTRWSDLRLRGIMAVAPLGMEPGRAFDRLAGVAGELRAEFPTARELSCGMSNDLEEAIDYGSTCVRVGTALLGSRGLASP